MAVWRQLEERGSYTVSPTRIGFPEEEDTAFHHAHYAYRWMSEQMRRRVGPPPEGVEFPVWAWYKQHGRADGKPDMRSKHYEAGKACVRMKLDVPDWEVLLSDFSDWHFPLNYGYLSASEEESEAFDAWCESLGVSFRDIGNWELQSPELDEVRARVESSWGRALGVNPVDEHWHSPWEMRSIQATFWVLRLEHVLTVEEFVSR